MVGGKREVFDRCKPLLEVVGKTVTYCGPVGSGQATKACNQVLCAVTLLGACEALALAKREGLDLQTTIAVTSAGAGGSWQLENLGPKIAAGDLDPGFMIDLLNKDLNIVEKAATRHRLPLGGAGLATTLFRAAANLGHGKDGTQALSRVLETLGGFEYSDGEE
jgi:3-hydroxyisobutyrate dehydrogenase